MAASRLQHEQSRGFLGEDRKEEGRRGGKAKYQLDSPVEKDATQSSRRKS